ATSLPVAASQTRATLSQPAETSNLPSGLKATLRTRSAWRSACSSLPVWASHTRATPSQQAPARRRPSGLKARAWTRCVLAANLRSVLARGGSQPFPPPRVAPGGVGPSGPNAGAIGGGKPPGGGRPLWRVVVPQTATLASAPIVASSRPPLLAAAPKPVVR